MEAATRDCSDPDSDAVTGVVLGRRNAALPVFAVPRHGAAAMPSVSTHSAVGA